MYTQIFRFSLNMLGRLGISLFLGGVVLGSTDPAIASAPANHVAQVSHLPNTGQQNSTTSSQPVHGSFNQATPTPTPTPTKVPEQPKSDSGCTNLPASAPVGAPGSKPVRICIPSLNIDTSVIPVGETASGAMDAPPQWWQAFWWSLGYVPGDNGNAVIAGHYTDYNGRPTLFNKLSTIQAGASIYLVEQNGYTYHFVVSKTSVVSNNNRGSNNPVLQEIFGSSNQPHLNLITCNGEWTGSDYNQRFIVFSNLVN